MNQLRATAMGVIADLRERRLVPVAIILLVLVVALPMVLSKPAEDVPPAKPSAAGASTSVDGLPDPARALDNDKPLVTLAVLDRPSDLNGYESRDPFKPLKSIGSGDLASTTPSTGADTQTGGVGGSTGGAGGSSGGGTGGSPSGGAGGSPIGGGGTPAAPGIKVPPLRPPTSRPKPERFTYVIDMKLQTPTGTKRYRKLQRLSLLPSQANPLLIFLGVGEGGNSAVFLVDSKLTAAGGEGHCSPNPQACATVSLEPGEIYIFTDQAGGRYVIELEQIDRVTVKSVQSRNAKARKKAKATAKASAGPAQKPVTQTDFVPLLIDLVTGGRR